ncbi:helix-turn-helix domain-containing protein [Aliamphritea ceti]|uniref:helix-turn-helix domain-containing protein n=1 Tax=Aliamphritea ceti TaxID=1524258 RepID=UPI0021C49C82|nr:helix-turn-helix transcriptional regulator [Aliamphritea ceti]
MNNTQKYIEKVRTFLKARDNKGSDLHLAKVMNVSRSAIYQWKTGRSGVDIREGYKIALLLEKDPLTVVGELFQDEFKNPETREFFQVVLDNQNHSDSAA